MPAVNEGEGVVEWHSSIRWGRAVIAGAISGAILLVVPWGSPWAGITFAQAAIMGRPVPTQLGMSFLEAALLHMLVACAYAVILAMIVARFRPDRAMLVGAIAGLGLYGLNFAAFRFLLPAMVGLEWLVAFSHVVFALMATAIYRGLAKRRAPELPPEP